MYTAQSVPDGKVIRQRISYYIDEDHPPGSPREYQNYLVSARAYLGAMVVDGYRFLKSRGLLEEYLNWRYGGN